MMKLKRELEEEDELGDWNCMEKYYVLILHTQKEDEEERL